MSGFVEKIFITPEGGVPMRSVAEVDAIEGCGLRGDRYCEGTGYWAPVDVCQVTLIEAEDLEDIQSTTGIQVSNGEHRRNLITRNIRLDDLAGHQFRIGKAVLDYDQPRPPCGYIQSITEPGMTNALAGRSGICARVVQSGRIRKNDEIIVL